jgi:hypothetical protein
VKLPPGNQAVLHVSVLFDENVDSFPVVTVSGSVANSVFEPFSLLLQLSKPA